MPRAGTGQVATGYRLILPSPWEQIPLRQGTEEAVRRILREAFARISPEVPPDTVGPYKRELERRFRAAVAEAQRGRALDVYLPVRPVGEAGLGASIVVSEALPPRRRAGGPPAPPTEVAVQLLTRDAPAAIGEADLSSGEIDEALAVRREYVAGADPSRGAELASRRVEYIASVPGDPARWFVAAFSTVGAGDPGDELSEVLVTWFDALMETFRWRYA
ncbi:hypothetical protein [Streptomyces sp. CS227]|uniref:hypothetical protein n=1 Tax=Streptomyces sp. CS227 TaxID=1982763 RepID=UPI00211B0464|nr:hypothetical protein [Streptomyces sp. CS227]